MSFLLGGRPAETPRGGAPGGRGAFHGPAHRVPRAAAADRAAGGADAGRRQRRKIKKSHFGRPYGAFGTPRALAQAQGRLRPLIL